MRHSYFGRLLSRSANERQQLFKNLVRDVILHGSIKTTVAKAKAVQPLVESMVTKAKRGNNSDMNAIRQIITDRAVIKSLMDDAKTRFATRNSGYTRIIKLGQRTSDASEMAQFGFVDEKVAVEMIAPKAKKTEAADKKEVKVEKKEKVEKVTKPKAKKTGSKKTE